MSDWDNEQARREGWGLFVLFEKPELQVGYDYEAYFKEPHPFRGGRTLEDWDAAALRFVKDKAAEGSAYHIDALARIQLL